MNNKAVILYSTVDGHTLKICNHIASQLEENGCNVNVNEISTFNKPLLDYNTVIIGASIRYGKHNKMVTQFILKNKEELEQINCAFFSVNLVARKIDKSTFYNNPYVQKYFKRINWKPKVIDVFAGRLDYNLYNFIDRLMIKLIMKITKGPVDSDKPIEFTDWKRVEEFSLKINRF